MRQNIDTKYSKLTLYDVLPVVPGSVEQEEGGDSGHEDHGEAAVLALLVCPALPPELHCRGQTGH